MKSVELFAGGGGLAIGLSRSGFKHMSVIEHNRDACNTLRLNECTGYGSRLFEGDIRDFDYNTIDDSIDLVSGGPPCQPFSLGGKHKAHNDNRDMFPEAVRAVRELSPKVFLFENVKGLLRSNFKEYFDYILLQLQYPSFPSEKNEDWHSHRNRLEAINSASLPEYKITYQLVNAADYGVPQKRERVFIIGFRNDINVTWSFPEPTHSQDALLWSKIVDQSYWEKHNILPPPRTKSEYSLAMRLQKKYKGSKPSLKSWRTVRDAISDIPDPRDTFASCNLDHHEFKDGAKSYPGHTGSYIDEPSKTLKAGGHGVPGGENMIRYEDGSVRYFTVRESARIQTFPDDFIFSGAWGEVMRQLGNAVPSQLAETIGISIYRSILSR
ncbi:DNA cytosine methyltransferase [Gallaecimonas xiamenensis]|uniref:DNA (cytosine-5-)-methyltransferase n=1 Tax=Gallaecimonas xiamenensis 3-C-1 TaxID=745411 RepID=K2J8W8_9GAMM|nr:DNA cytosine methyltransferase [Gallaecimonas xiamenensis]EKE71653.1 DNA cytosine methyltransferase M.NgoMIII [Gallaecimonas xiamenensis 3-C-1]